MKNLFYSKAKGLSRWSPRFAVGEGRLRTQSPQFDLVKWGNVGNLICLEKDFPGVFQQGKVGYVADAAAGDGDVEIIDISLSL